MQGYKRNQCYYFGVTANEYVQNIESIDSGHGL